MKVKWFTCLGSVAILALAISTGFSRSEKISLAQSQVTLPEALPNLYPWTGLGYTYDWGIYPKTPLQTDAGLSEFIIFLPPNTEPSVSIEVKGVFSTEEYCKKE
jgi:hypothetical protein